MKKGVQTDKAPEAIGPYNQGMITDGKKLLFTAGQVPVIPGTKTMRDDTIEAATEQTLENIKAILTAAGTGLEHVVKMTVFLADISDFAAMNAVYAKYFPSNPPARSAIQVAALPMGARIEMEAIALVP